MGTKTTKPTVDNGSVRLAFTTPLALTAGANLIVVADITQTVNSAAAGLALAALTLLPIGFTRRRAQISLVAAAVLTTWLLVGCGGGEGPCVQTTPPPPVAVTLTYRIELTGVDATDDASPALR